MTLIDSRPGVHACMTRLPTGLGVFIDAVVVVPRLGPPLEVELAEWMPSADVPAAADRYRALMAESGAVNCSALPGALEAVRAIRGSGGGVGGVGPEAGPLPGFSPRGPRLEGARDPRRPRGGGQGGGGC